MTQHFDTLEARRMFSAALKGTTLNLRGTSADDAFVVRRSGTQILVERNGAREGTFPTSKVQRLSVVLGEGNDSLESKGRLPRMMVDAGNGDDRVITSAGNDFVSGGAGVDRIYTFGGDDVVDPGVGDDSTEGGTGTNTIDYSTRSEGVSINLENSSAGASAGGETDVVRQFSRALGGSGGDMITGSPRTTDVLWGNGGSDTVVARGAYDELYGGVGDDTLVDAFGTTLMDGGAGSDRVDYLASSVDRSWGVGVNLSDGTGSGLNVRDEYDHIFDCERVRGTSLGDILIGDDSANTIDGSGGNDMINGGAGADTLSGGLGNDTFTANDGTVDEINGGDGSDYAAPDFIVFPFGRSSRDTLTSIEQVGDPKPFTL